MNREFGVINEIGEVIQITGAVLDIRFPASGVPAINSAIKIHNHEEVLIAEVAQQLGDGVVRCIAMGPTNGLTRGVRAINTRRPISVPVGDGTLGRMFNVLGDPIDDTQF